MTDAADTPKSPGRWKKGQSGNPGGRPKGLLPFVKRCRKEGSPLAFATLMREMVGGGKNNVRAAEIMLAYAWGPPKQPIELTGPGGGPVPLEVKDNADPGRIKAILGVLATVGILPAGVETLGAGAALDSENDEVHSTPAAPDTGGVSTS